MGILLGNSNPLVANNPATTVTEFYDQEKRKARIEGAKTIGFSPIAVPLGAVDTVGQSVGLLDEDTMNEAISSVNKTLGDTYKGNASGYRAFGDLVTTFTGVGATTKILRGTSLLTRAGSIGAKGAQVARDVTGGRSDFVLKLLHSDTTRVDQMLEQLKKKSALLGESGVTNTVNVNSTKTLARQARFAQGKNDLKEGLVAEAFIFGLQSESELYFPEGQSTSDMLLMSGAGLGLGSGLGQLFLTPALKKAHGAAGKAKAARQDEFTQRDSTNLVMGAALIDEVDNSPLITDLVTQMPEARNQINAAKASAQNKINDSVTNLMNADPMPGITSAVGGLAERTTIDTLTEFAKSNPRLTANVVSVDKGNALEKFYTEGSKLTKKYEAEVLEIDKSLKKATGIDAVQLQDRKTELKASLAQLNGGVNPVRLNKLGQLSSDSSAPSIFNERNVNISFKKQDVVNEDFGKTVFFVNDSKDKFKNGLAVDGTLWANGRKTANSFGMTRYNSEKFYAVQHKAIKELGKVLQDGTSRVKPTVISRTAAHETLDYVVNAVRAYGGQNQSLDALRKVMDLSEFKDLDDLRHATMQSKFNRFRVEMDSWSKAHRGGANIENFTEELGGKLMLKFSDDHGGGNYGMQWFSSLHVAGETSIGKDYAASMSDFGTTFSVGAGGRTVATVRDSQGIELYDDLIDVNYLDKLNKDRKPLTLFVDNNNRTSDILDAKGLLDIAKDFENRRQTILSAEITSNPYTAGNLGLLEEYVNNLPQIAEGIADGARRPTQGQGANPLFEQLGSMSPTTQLFNLRGVPGSEAFSSYADGTQRIMRKAAENYLKENTTSMQGLRLKGNEVSAQRFLNFISAERLGWDLLDDAADATGRYRLDPDSARNKKIASHRNSPHNGKVPEFMPSVFGDGTSPLVVDELAAGAIAEARAISDIQWNAQNIISKSIGRKGLSYRKGHTLRPTNSDNRIYITDATGRVVDYVTGNTVEQAKQQASSVVAGLNKNAKGTGSSGGFGLITKDTVEEYKTANNQFVTADALTFNSSGISAKARGGRVTAITDVRYIDDMLEETHGMFQSMGKQYTTTRFANELENLRQLEVNAQVENKGFFKDAAGNSGTAFTSVYKGLADQLTNSTTRNTGSLYGGLGVLTETMFGAAWTKAFDLMGTAGRNPVSSKNFNKISQELANEHGFDPATFAADFADKAIAGRTLPKGAKVVRQLAGITQALALKWGEVGHAMLTTASIVTTTPHAVKYMGRLANESAEDFKQRVGWAADLLGDNDAVPNPTKLTLATTMKYFKGEYKDVLADAAKMGYTDANVAEFMAEFTQKRGGKLENLLVAADKYSGMVSMKSEEWAREVAFLTGYEMYRNIGKNGHKVSMAAANDIANKAIADYRPHQRAELFKGTSGVPLAMFQTFAINYFQRLASSVENKAWGSALVQGGTQAFMFGGQSVPGFDVFNEVLLENWDESRRPEDLFREGFKNEKLGQLMLYGTPSALPMMLGADNGVALFSRGEMQLPRNVTPLTIFDTPFFSMISRTSGAVKEGFAAASSEVGNGGGHALREALIYSIPNRPLRGIAEIAQGYSTNKNGDIINDELRNWFGGAVHAAGLKTVRDAEKSALLWRDRQTEVSHRTAQRRLGRSVEALVRSRNLDEITGDEIANIVNKYVAYGGSSKGAKRWLKNRVLKAEISKFDRELTKKIRSSKEGKHLLRFLDVEE